VTAFFAGFGWTGVAAIRNGSSLMTALLLAILVGSVFMAGVVLLMKALYSMRHSGTINYATTVGEIGTVYMRVPGGMNNPGQVEVMVQGRLMIAQALSRSEEQIPNQSRVRIVDVLGENTLIVEPLHGDGATETEEE
jgi:membrane protein implicated in regulation of membrane protease activity